MPKAIKEKSETDWIRIKQDEFEKLVVELGKKGNSPAKIGIILRDNHGIPKAKVFGKKIKKILDDNKISYKKEKELLEEKISKIKKHLQTNKYDQPASRSLTKKLWKVYNLEKAY